MRSMRPDPEIRVQKITIPAGRRRIPALVLSPKETPVLATGVLWIHGGGYILGMKEMVHMSRAVDLVKKFGAVVVSPGYRLALTAPYPAALDDCYAALLYMKAHAAELGIRADQIMVGGESAGGGLCAALCIKARDTGAVNVAFQMPLYPMLDDRDTETSRDNHGKVWNTRRNHFGWRCYLRGQKRDGLSPYAVPARLTDFSGLPPAYTFVGDGEPFYAETVQYIENLRKCGIPASVDVYHSDMHAFDMMQPDTPLSQEAARRFGEQFAYAQAHYFAAQGAKRQAGNSKSAAGQMETLFVYALLCGVGYDQYDAYRKTLDRLFLEDPDNAVLLDLECREYKDAMLHLYHLMETTDFDTAKLGKRLMLNLKAIYKASDLADFAKEMYQIWLLLPERLEQEEPFFVFSYADEYLDFGDEKQCRKLYEKALGYYDNGAED